MKYNYFTLLLAVTALTIFSFLNTAPPYAYIGILLMLFFPFFDSAWQKPELSLSKISASVGLVCICLFMLLILKPESWPLIISSLLFAALPEEWFFRGYLMVRIKQILNSPWQANILTSIIFSLFHLPTQGWFGLSVFLPSLVFGWLYQKTNNMVLIIGVHALSNILFIIYLTDLL
jgi:membrane protease YdiL (CAAX protease family)